MELSSLETKTHSARGAFLHLKHPALGHKLYTGAGASPTGEMVDRNKAERVGVTVVGTESERVRERAKALQKSKMRGDNDDEAAGLTFVCSLVTEFHGITQGGKRLDCTEENKRLFFEQSDSLVEQVLTFAQDRANFWQATSEA